MEDADHLRLLGKYRTPRVRVGRFVRCLIRGEVKVVGFTDGPIPWPKGKTTRRPAIIVYADLARAVRRTSTRTGRSARMATCCRRNPTWSATATSSVLGACPRSAEEETRSGTWPTVRYARKQGKPVYLVLPDGEVRVEKR